MASENVRYLTDPESLQALIALMPDKERREFQTYKCRTIESASVGRIMVVYKFDGRDATDIEVFKCLDYFQPFQEVPQFRISYQGRTQLITPVPSRLGDRSVFLSVPQNFVLRWAGQEVASGLQFRPQFAMLVQTRSKAELLIDGDTQCVTLKRFKERYPHKADEVRF